MGNYPVARIEIQDARLVIVFPDAEFDAKTPEERRAAHEALAAGAAREGLVGDVVLVWRDRSGAMRFLAPPEQHPFLQVVHYDQLRAQANGTLHA